MVRPIRLDEVSLYHCLYCSKMFRTKDWRDKHRLTCESTPKLDSLKTPELKKELVELRTNSTHRFFCVNCDGMSFPTQKGLNTHYKRCFCKPKVSKVVLHEGANQEVEEQNLEKTEENQEEANEVIVTDVTDVTDVTNVTNVTNVSVIKNETTVNNIPIDNRNYIIGCLRRLYKKLLNLHRCIPNEYYNLAIHTTEFPDLVLDHIDYLEKEAYFIAKKEIQRCKENNEDSPKFLLNLLTEYEEKYPKGQYDE